LQSAVEIDAKKILKDIKEYDKSFLQRMERTVFKRKKHVARTLNNYELGLTQMGSRKVTQALGESLESRYERHCFSA
jgi:hypothetical protein